MISVKILKISSPSITLPLNISVIKIFLKAFFTDRLKFSLIRPMYKNGSKLGMTNYIPASLLTAF